MSMHEDHDLYLDVQLEMGKWLEAGLPMPITGINMNMSNLLLRFLLGKDSTGRFDLDEDQARHCRAMIGPNGYAYYRALLACRGEFVLDEALLGLPKVSMDGP